MKCIGQSSHFMHFTVAAMIHDGVKVGNILLVTFLALEWYWCSATRTSCIILTSCPAPVWMREERLVWCQKMNKTFASEHRLFSSKTFEDELAGWQNGIVSLSNVISISTKSFLNPWTMLCLMIHMYFWHLPRIMKSSGMNTVLYLSHFISKYVEGLDGDAGMLSVESELEC